MAHEIRIRNIYCGIRIRAIASSSSLCMQYGHCYGGAAACMRYMRINSFIYFTMQEKKPEGNSSNFYHSIFSPLQPPAIAIFAKNASSFYWFACMQIFSNFFFSSRENKLFPSQRFRSLNDSTGDKHRAFNISVNAKLRHYRTSSLAGILFTSHWHFCYRMTRCWFVFLGSYVMEKMFFIVHECRYKLKRRITVAPAPAQQQNTKIMIICSLVTQWRRHRYQRSLLNLFIM